MGKGDATAGSILQIPTGYRFMALQAPSNALFR
jgi:hypothetical protein